MSHVSDIPLAMSVESTIRQAAGESAIADGDLTSQTAAKAALDITRAAAHVSAKPRYFGFKDAIDKAAALSAASVTGSSLNDIYALSPGTPAKGFAVTF